MLLGSVSFRIYNPNNKIYEAIESLYRPEKKEVDDLHRLIKIVALSPMAIQKTKELLTRGLKIDDTYVRFIYSEEELSNFCKESGYEKTYYLDRFSDVAINSHFQTLNASPGDSFELVKQSYMRLIKEYHPDNVFGKDAQTIRNYTQKFQSIQSAFESIKSHYKKAI
jgi:DnaJ-domain-containing protein 1